MGPGQDQITDALAKMPRAALFDIMSQMKGLIQQNQQQARQILVTNPSLTRALFQAQILLGMLKNPLATGAVPPQQQAAQPQAVPAQPVASQRPQQQFLPPHIAQQAPQQAMPMQAPVQAVRPQQAHVAANGQYPPQDHMQPQPVSQVPGGPGRGAPRPGPAPVQPQAQPAMQYGAPMQQGPGAITGPQPRWVVTYCLCKLRLCVCCALSLRYVHMAQFLDSTSSTVCSGSRSNCNVDWNSEHQVVHTVCISKVASANAQLLILDCPWIIHVT